MSKARNIIKRGGDRQPNFFASWGSWVKKVSIATANSGLGWSVWGYSYARHIGWFVVTTGIITALPLVFEIKREMQIEEMERIQIDAALAEGKTPHELASLGLAAAVEPKVLK